MAAFTDDVTRLQNDVNAFKAFKSQVETYIQQNQAQPQVDTTSLEAALSDLEGSLTSANAEVSAAENPAPAIPTPAPTPAPAPSSGTDAGTSATS